MGGSGACLSQPYGRVFRWTWSLPLKLGFLVIVLPRAHLSLPQKHWSYRHTWPCPDIYLSTEIWILVLLLSKHVFLPPKSSHHPQFNLFFYTYAVSKRVACCDMHVHVRWLTGDIFFFSPNRFLANSGLVASVLTHWTILLAPNSVFIGFYHIINSPG